MTSTTSPVKQRKLSDLRVADLQRELRSFEIFYDKKELKGSLLEKLRQALIDRKLDPDTYFFQTSADSKTMSSEEGNQSHDENGHNHSEVLSTEVDMEPAPLEIDITEQGNETSPLHSPETATAPMFDNHDDSSNRMDTIDLRRMVEDRDSENIFSTMDPSTLGPDDDYSNDNIDAEHAPASRSPLDEQVDTNSPTQSSPNSHTYRQRASPTGEQRDSPEQDLGEETHQTSSRSPPPWSSSTTATTELPTDNENLSISDTKRQTSTDESARKSRTNKDQCHLWVSNIAKETHASDLKTLFSKYGKVLTTKVIGSTTSQWYGYINLATPDDVEKCITALNQTELHGKKIYVDREMHDQPTHSPAAKSKSNSDATSSQASRKAADYSSYKSSSYDAHRKRDSITASDERSSATDSSSSSRKRPASTSSDNSKKKLSTSDVKRSNYDEKPIRSPDRDSSKRRSTEPNRDVRRTPSGSSSGYPAKQHVSRADTSRASDKTESSHRSSSATNRFNDRPSGRSERPPTHSTDTSRTRAPSPFGSRDHSSEKRPTSSSTRSDHHRSSSIDKSRPRSSTHSSTNRYDQPREPTSRDTHRPTSSSTYDSDRRSTYQSEHRLRQEKEILARKQYVQQQEEEKIKEQERRLAEERERVRREFEILQRQRSEIERTRLALEKEKQDQARELDKQQRRLADEAKHRQQQAEAKLRDEKLQRLAHHDAKRARPSQHDSPRSHYSSTNNGTSSSKGYDHRSSSNNASERPRDRSLGETSSRDYYSDSKRPYSSTSNSQRETSFRERPAYRDSELPASASSASSSSIIPSSSNNPRYFPASSTQHRPVDPYNTLPQRGRDMALPPTSSVSSAYERSSRSAAVSPPGNSAILRRPHSRERFDDREYLQQAQRRDRSPPTSTVLRREPPLESAHWDRPKPRDNPHYADDTRKYLPNQYLSESSSSVPPPQGLWSAAPPSRPQPHHHSDLPMKTSSHASVGDPYSWQHVPPQVPPSSHDRPRGNVISNPRIPMLSSNQPPPPPPPSSRGGTTGPTHLYNHPGVSVGTLPSSQQHASLVPPPSLHHTTAYVSQQAPPPGLVLHPAGQTRAYEPHYVVTQPLPQRRY